MRAAAFAVALFGISPAAACLPPPAGYVPPLPPTAEQRAAEIARAYANIVEGVVIRAQGARHEPLFRITRVYKGKLKAGMVVRAGDTWGFREMMCPGMIPPRPVLRGARGVIAFDDEPMLAFIQDDWLRIMREQGMLPRGSRLK